MTRAVPTHDGGVTLCKIAIVTPETAVATVAEHPAYEISRALEGDTRASATILGDHLVALRDEFYSEVSAQIGGCLDSGVDR